ncbi:YjjG family noncanonical pyrimidine nucleotidase [Cryomorphaceae bacterium 1068]|nr:YjjG family noncanonical pyrimidine nucleotidase [Cryomorphaceae bacterium 1068]
MPKYEHVFFDLDRTLWDFDTNSKLALGEIFNEFKLKEKGIDSSIEFIDVYQDINEKLWDLYRKGLLNKRKLRSLRFSRTLEHFGLVDEYLGEQLGTAYVEISPHKTAVLPNCMEILDYLAGRYEMHIITNGFEEVQNIKLDKSGLAKYFSKIITSEQAGARKPDPKVFDYAFGLTSGKVHNSLMIGDDLRTDIEGARKIEMDHVYYNPHRKDHSEDLFHEIADLLELKNLL